MRLARFIPAHPMHQALLAIFVTVCVAAMLFIWLVAAKAQCMPDDLNCMNLP